MIIYDLIFVQLVIKIISCYDRDVRGWTRAPGKNHSDSRANPNRCYDVIIYAPGGRSTTTTIIIIGVNIFSSDASERFRFLCKQWASNLPSRKTWSHFSIISIIQNKVHCYIVFALYNSCVPNDRNSRSFGKCFALPSDHFKPSKLYDA